jgi:hypothetical protein
MEVQELLQPLFHRLHDIESQNVSLYETDFLENARTILNKIKKDLFSVVNRGVLIGDLKRIQEKLERLRQPNSDYTNNADNEFPFAKPIEEVNAIVVEELSLYNDAINVYLKELNDNSAVTRTIFQLPDNFNANVLQKAGFIPLLNEKGAAYFLYLLRECKFLPDYTNASLSMLAPILLGRGQQNARENFGKILNEIGNKDAVKELRILKEELERLQLKIDSLLADK